MAFKTINTVITLDGKDLVRLQEILMDDDTDEALKFLREVIETKIGCAQAETHKTEFEGGGSEASHFLQKGDTHASSDK